MVIICSRGNFLRRYGTISFFLNTKNLRSRDPLCIFRWNLAQIIGNIYVRDVIFCQNFKKHLQKASSHIFVPSDKQNAPKMSVDNFQWNLYRIVGNYSQNKKSKDKWYPLGTRKLRKPQKTNFQRINAHNLSVANTAEAIKKIHHERIFSDKLV